jgi:hypothetical protein
MSSTGNFEFILILERNCNYMSKKEIKVKDKKSFKKHEIIIIVLMIIVIIILLFFILKPIKLFVPSDSSLEKIGIIDENRSVYTYHVNKILIFPSMNEKMSTKEFLNGTVQTGFIWDGGTSINQGIGFIVVDCQDGLKPHRSSPIIITTKDYIESARSYCHS